MYQITSFYIFAKLGTADQQQVNDHFAGLAKEHGWNGLVILGPEGINATMSNTDLAQVQALQLWLRDRFPEQKILFKDSVAEAKPFKRFSTHVREEIVTIGHPELVPAGSCNHLSPEEWQRILDHEKDYVLLDTRNTYETEVGVFKGAIDPKITTFGEFPERIPQLDLPKDKKILMYCTGGIRCEKAILAMQQAGYDNCYQLEGGILAYLEKFPNQAFEGECFVFDQRVAVDQKLAASQEYRLCPHCGNAGNQQIKCLNCEGAGQVCRHCLQMGKQSCSKNCQHHVVRRGLSVSEPAVIA